MAEPHDERSPSSTPRAAPWAPAARRGQALGPRGRRRQRAARERARARCSCSGGRRTRRTAAAGTSRWAATSTRARSFDAAAVREAGEELFEDAASPRVRLGAATRRSSRGSADGATSTRRSCFRRVALQLEPARRAPRARAAALRNVVYHVASYLGRTDVPLDGFRPPGVRDRGAALRRARRGGPPARCAASSRRTWRSCGSPTRAPCWRSAADRAA